MDAIQVGDRTFVWPSAGRELLARVRTILNEEERRVLELHPLLSWPEEHILIHFVRMYLFRFAVPAIEIEVGGLPPHCSERIRERMWLCFYGRALDDLADDDSRFFSRGDSAVILTYYWSLISERLHQSRRGHLIQGLLKAAATAVLPSPKEAPTASTSPSPHTCHVGDSALDADRIRATRSTHSAGGDTTRQPNGTVETKSAPLSERMIALFDAVGVDVCRRVEYYLLPTAVEFPERLPLLRRFIGVLLAGCDLDDVIADGTGRAATRLSHQFVRDLADDEGKVQLNRMIDLWHKAATEQLVQRAKTIMQGLDAAGAAFSHSVAADEVRRLTAEMG